MTTGENLVQQLTEALNLTKQYVENLTRTQETSDVAIPPENRVQQLEEKAVQNKSSIAGWRHPLVIVTNDYLRQTGNWLSEEKYLLSLVAWHTVLTYFAEKTDNLLGLLAILSRLRRELELLFPDARDFKRPGLD